MRVMSAVKPLACSSRSSVFSHVFKSQPGVALCRPGQTVPLQLLLSDEVGLDGANGCVCMSSGGVVVGVVAFQAFCALLCHFHHKVSAIEIHLIIHRFQNTSCHIIYHKSKYFQF